MKPYLPHVGSLAFVLVVGGLLLRQPAPIDPPVDVKAEAGIALWKMKMDDLAGRTFAEVLAEDPNHPRANFAIGVAAYQTKRFKEAEQRLMTALKQDPQNAEIKLSLGVAYQRAKRYGDAERIYQELVREHPEDPRFLNNLAEVEIGRRNYPMARAYLEAHLAKLPRRSTRRKHAEKRLAQLNEQIGDRQPASPAPSAPSKKAK